MRGVVVLGGGLAIAVAVFISINLTIGLHPDDVQIISDVGRSSYSDLWSAAFLDRFYRPLVMTLVRATDDLFGSVALPLRILQGILIAASVHTVVTVVSHRVAEVARYSAGLFLLASPWTFVSISPFAVGIGDLVVGLLFLLAVRACLHAEHGSLGARTAAALVGVSILALFSKESGVLVAAYCASETARRGHRLAAATIVAAALGYLALRSTFVSREYFEFSTGYFFDSYSAEDLDREFGAAPARLYAYNAVSNLANVLVGFPEKGLLRPPLHAVLLIPVTTLTSLLVARYLTVQRRWRTVAPLVLVVVLNALLGYAYVRSRVMFVGAFAMSILVLFMIDDLLRRPQRVLGLEGRTIAGLVVAAWACVLVHSLARLALQATA